MSDENLDTASDAQATEPASMLDAIEAGLAVEAGDGHESDANANDGGTDKVEAQSDAATDPSTEAAVHEKDADATGDAPKEPETVAETATPAVTDSPAGDPAPADAGTDTPQTPTPGDELTPPEGLNDSARDRFQKLAQRARNHEREATEFKGQYEQLTSVIRDAGATPDDMQAFLSFTAARKAGNLDAALDILDAQRKDIAIASGRAVPGVDLLALHPDLKERVATFNLAQDTAEEIARAREQVTQAQSQEAQRQQLAQQQAQTAQQQQATQAAQHKAAQEVGQLEAQWRASDPDFAIKEPMLREQVTHIASTFPPEQWAQQIRWGYETIGKLAASAAPAAKTPAPLTGASTTANPNGAVPKTMHEAMWGESG